MFLTVKDLMLSILMLQIDLDIGSKCTKLVSKSASLQ
jgi:hypothetical protein